MITISLKIKEFDSESFLPYAMEYDGDSVTVYMDQTASEEVRGEKSPLFSMESCPGKLLFFILQANAEIQ